MDDISTVSACGLPFNQPRFIGVALCMHLLARASFGLLLRTKKDRMAGYQFIWTAAGIEISERVFVASPPTETHLLDQSRRQGD